MKDPIYLDYNATCPIAPEVLEVTIPALRDAWGNPSSGNRYAHFYGHGGHYYVRYYWKFFA